MGIPRFLVLMDMYSCRVLSPRSRSRTEVLDYRRRTRERPAVRRRIVCFDFSCAPGLYHDILGSRASAVPVSVLPYRASGLI